MLEKKIKKKKTLNHLSAFTLLVTMFYKFESIRIYSHEARARNRENVEVFLSRFMRH